MTKQSDDTRKSLSRRRVLTGAAATGAGALPLALALPSEAHKVVTEDLKRAAAIERERLFRANVHKTLGQAAPHLPPGTMPPPPRTRVPYNTQYDTSISTNSTTDTFSRKPEVADDVNHQTYSDGSKADFKTDYQ